MLRPGGFTIGISTLLLLIGIVQPALAIDAFEIWRETLAHQGKLSFEGVREQTVWRSDRARTARTRVDYVDATHYSIGIETPETKEPLRFAVHDGKTWAAFPDDGLYFGKGSPETALFPAQVLLAQLPDWNQREGISYYSLTRHPDEFVALTPCYVLEFKPILNLAKPRVVYHISQDSYQILAVSRSRDFFTEYRNRPQPYFESRYLIFSPGRAGVSEPAFGPGGVQVDLERTLGNAFKTYASPAEAEAAEQLKIYQPGYLPEGFKLRQVQVLRVFGVPIQILNYSDGINLLAVAAQPQIDPLRILMSGLINLNYYGITRRMIQLKAYAPYDFYSRNTPATQTVVFGDLASDELMRISQSLPVP